MAKRAGRATKNKIIKASKKVFLEEGIENGTYAKIGEAADVDPNLITYHFGSKAELAKIIIEEYNGKLWAYYRACLEEIHQTLSPIETYCLIVRLNCKIVLSNAKFARFYKDCLEQRIFDVNFFAGEDTAQMYENLFEHYNVTNEALKKYWHHIEYAHLREYMYLIIDKQDDHLEEFFTLFCFSMLQIIRVPEDEICEAFSKAKTLCDKIDISKFKF